MLQTQVDCVAPPACFGMFVGGAAAQISAAVIARQGAEKIGTEKVQVKNLYFHQWRLLIVLQSQKAEKAKKNAARAVEKEAKKAERHEVR